MTVQTLYQNGIIDGSGVIGAVAAFNGYYFAGVLFLISVVLFVVISYTSEAPLLSSITGLTFATATDEQRDENRSSWGMPEVLGTIVVLGLVAGIYIYFSFWLG